MSSQSKQLVKVIADIAIALEFTDDTLINPDVAIEMQESIAGTLQSLDGVDRKDIANVFESIARSDVRSQRASPSFRFAPCQKLTLRYVNYGSQAN